MHVSILPPRFFSSCAGDHLLAPGTFSPSIYSFPAGRGWKPEKDFAERIPDTFAGPPSIGLCGVWKAPEEASLPREAGSQKAAETVYSELLFVLGGGVGAPLLLPKTEMKPNLVLSSSRSTEDIRQYSQKGIPEALSPGHCDNLAGLCASEVIRA